jgi:peptidylprolyl isomerase
VTQYNRPRKGAPQPPRQNPALGAVSALVVVAIFIALGFMLANRAAGTAAPPEATPLPFAEATASSLPGDPTPASPDAAVPTPAGPDSEVAARLDKYAQAPAMSVDPAKTYTATITTPRGDIVIRLRPDLAPETVNSFVFLAREGYFDGITWHRVIPGFVAQGGDPTGTGMGGPGYLVKGEFSETVLFDKPGIVAMARPGNDVNGNGSQFFITLAPTPELNGQYTIFGEVTQGLDIVEGIPARDPDTAPTPGEQMVKVTVTES